MSERGASRSPGERAPAPTRPVFATRLATRLFAAFPRWRELVAGSLLWAIAVCLAMLASLWRTTGWIDSHLLALAVVSFCGGLLAYLPARVSAHLVSAGRPAGARFAAAFVGLTFCTVVASSLCYAAQFIQHDVNWTGFGDPSFPYLDLVKSLIGSEMLYAAFGLRLFLPSALPGLVLASLLVMRRLR